MIGLNPGSAVKDVSGVYINTGSGVKTVDAVYINIGGTLYQVYPDYAYDGNRFAGVLSGGLVNCPSKISNYDGNGRTYTVFNDLAFGASITSGALYVSQFNSYDQGSLYTPAICVSARTVNFSKYSTVRITGYWVAYARSINGYHSTEVSPAVGIEAITINGSTVTSYGSRSASCGSWSWKSSQYEEGYGNSGNISFDVTLDISAITASGVLAEFFAGPGVYKSSYSLLTVNVAFHITSIKFEA